MKPATDRQKRARRGKACFLTSLKMTDGVRHTCGPARLRIIEGVRVIICAKHAKRLRSIVADAKKADAKHRRSIGLKAAA